MNTTDVIGRGFTHPISLKNGPATPRYHTGEDGKPIPTTFWQHTLDAESRGKNPPPTETKK